MEWSNQQIELYNKLMSSVYPLASWREVAERCFEDAKVCGPASEEDIQSAQTALGRQLPDELASFYRSSNGLQANYGSPIIMPVEELAKENSETRALALKTELYMPFDGLLFFGGEGNGDLHGFSIVGPKTYGQIFRWEHESDSRNWAGLNLKNYLIRLAVNLSA